MSDTREWIDQMELTEGWALVDRYLVSRLAYHREQLEHCPVDEVLLHRTALTELNLLYAHIEELKTPSE